MQLNTNSTTQKHATTHVYKKNKNRSQLCKVKGTICKLLLSTAYLKNTCI